MMMDDSVLAHERRKLVKTYNVRPQKQTVVAEVCEKTYSKNDKKD